MKSNEELIKENIQLKQTLDNLIINFNKLSHKIIHSSDIDETLEALFDLCADIFSYEEIAVFLLKSEFELKKYRDLPDESYLEISDIQEEDIFDWVILQNKQIVLPRKYKNGSYILLPLTVRNKSIGILLLGVSKEKDSITKEEQDILNIISAQVAVAIENSTLYSSLEEKNKKLDNIKNYMGNIIQSFNEGIIVIDTDYTVTTVNETAEKYLNIKREDLLLKNIRLFISNWLTPEFFDLVDSSFTNSEVYNHVVDLSGKYLKFSIIPLKGIYKNIIGAIIHIEDMTTSIEYERLKEIDDFKDQVISNVSHELKTPLTSISAYAETLIDMVDSIDDEQKDDMKEFLNVINDESARLLDLIMEILDTSKLESGKIYLNISEICINSILDRIISGMEQFFKEKNIKIIKHYDENENFLINADKIKIEQVFYNIVSNAIKYNNKNGSIDFSILKDDQGVSVKVKDSGIGIDKKNLDNIFDKFFRENTEEAKTVGGFGLGLNIVKNIIDLHKGRIDIRSEKNKGTEMEIFLPYEQTDI